MVLVVLLWSVHGSSQEAQGKCCILAYPMTHSPHAYTGGQKVGHVLPYSGILTHSYLKGHVKIVVWIYGNFDNNFGIKKDCTNYLKESCR